MNPGPFLLWSYSGMEPRLKLFDAGGRLEAAGSRGRRGLGSKGRARRRLLIERLADRRVLATISGMVFEDFDDGLRPSAAEMASVGRLVYLDRNDDGSLDAGDRVAITDADGRFAFEDVPDGEHVVRLYDGTTTQSLTFPLRSSATGAVVTTPEQVSQTLVTEDASWVLTPAGLLGWRLDDADPQWFPFGRRLERLADLPGGRFLVVGGEDPEAEAWLFDPAAGQATAALTDEAGSGQPVGPGGRWRDVGAATDGRGLLLRESPEGLLAYALDATDPEAPPEIQSSEFVFPHDSRLYSSAAGNRSLVAWAGDNGLDAILWSNATATPISDPAKAIAGVTEILDFDDASGLLVARTVAGGVGVFDVDAEFAPLHEFPRLTGPVALDGGRELLFAVEPSEGRFRVIDLRTGSGLTQWAIDVAAVGQATGLRVTADLSHAILFGAAGIARLDLQRSPEHRVSVSQGEFPEPVRFGVRDSGPNAAPVVSSAGVWTVREGRTLSEPAPAALSGIVDPDGDSLVLISAGGPTHGTGFVGPDGAITYTPEAGFVGTDAFSLVVHDGRHAVPFDLQILVQPAPDPITGVTPDSGSIVENVVGDVIAELTVEGRGEEQFYFIETSDPRFLVEFGELRLAPGVSLDYEQEPEVHLELTVIDPLHGDTFVQPFVVTVIDVPERPQSIALTSDTVVALRPGAVVGDVLVDGVVPVAGVAFTVNEPFEIVAGTLQLASGRWVEEVPQEIQVSITAQDEAGVFAPRDATFIIQVLENSAPYHNESLPLDVNGDGVVTALDALLIINYLNAYGPGEVGHGDPSFGYDVNGDGMVTALDALLIINQLNQPATTGSTGTGEGEGAGRGEADRPDAEGSLHDKGSPSSRLPMRLLLSEDQLRRPWAEGRDWEWDEIDARDEAFRELS